MFERLIKEAMDGGLDCAYLVYGKHIRQKNKEKAEEFWQKAFDIWHREFLNHRLDNDDYSRLIEVSELLGRNDIAKKVREAKNAIKDEQVKWFGKDNLATDRSGVDRFELPNNDNFELPFYL